MSWKIYEGLRIKARTFYEVHQFVRELQPIAKKHLLDFNAKAIAAKAFKDYDLIDLGINDNEGDKKYLENAFKAIIFDEEYHEKLQIDNKFFIGFAAVSKNSKYVLALPFMGKTPNLTFIVHEHPLVEEYPYWNNTDKDDRITAAEWAKRKRDWNEVFGNNDGVPNHQMFMHQVADRTFCIPNLDMIKNMAPTITERYADCVEVLLSKKVREEHNTIKGDKEFNYSEYFDFYKKYRKTHYSSIFKSIDGRLNENVTIEDLQGEKNES